jgi:micrococcal nuclease
VKRLLLRLALAALAALAIHLGWSRPPGEGAAAAGTDLECTVRRVGDGDSLDCEEARRRVRLVGIDAPELAQGSPGKRARRHLFTLAPKGTRLRLELDRERKDKHGRTLAYAWRADGRLVNEEMVRAGYAVPFTIEPNVRHRARLRRAADEAKRAGAGLWASGGFRCAPVDFRHGRCR